MGFTWELKTVMILYMKNPLPVDTSNEKKISPGGGWLKSGVYRKIKIHGRKDHGFIIIWIHLPCTHPESVEALRRLIR